MERLGYGEAREPAEESKRLHKTLKKTSDNEKFSFVFLQILVIDLFEAYFGPLFWSLNIN